MGIYIMTFIISCLLLAFSTKIKNIIPKRIIEIVGLLIPCIIAGLRVKTIGTDVEVYLEPLFNLAQNADSFSDFLNMRWWYIWHYKNVVDFEVLFTGLIFIVSRLSHSIQFLMFVVQVLIVFPVYFGLKKFKSYEQHAWFGMLCFYLLFYNISLNLIRQFIGISIVFWGACCLINKKRSGKFFLLTIIIASLFHKSSLLGLIIYGVYILLNNDFKHEKILVLGSNRIKAKKLILFIVIFMLILLVVNSSVIGNLLTFLELDYYNEYISGELTFTMSKVIKFIPIIILLFLNIKSFSKTENAYFLIAMFAINILVSQFSTINVYAIRIGYIFQIFNIIIFLQLISNCKKNENKFFLGIFIIVILGVLWYYDFVYLGMNETIPYVFYFNE